MKKMLVVLVAMLLAGMALESNIAFADEVDRIIQECIKAYEESKIAYREAKGEIKRAGIVSDIDFKIVKKLSRIGDSRAFEALIGLLKDVWKNSPFSTSEVYIVSDYLAKGLKVSVVNIIGENPDHIERIIPQLAEMLRNPTQTSNRTYRNLYDYPISLAATDALVEIAKNDPSQLKTIQGIFLDAIQSGDGARWYMRRYAAWALGEIGGEESVPHLLDALNSSHWITRRWAATSLGKIASPVATVGLIAALNDRDGVVILRAIESLGKIAEFHPGEIAPIAPALILKLGRGDDVSKEAVRALGAMGSAVVPYLIEVLDNAREAVFKKIREDIIRTLCSISDSRTASILIGAIEDPTTDYILRLNAISALGKMDNPQATDFLVQVVKKGGDGAFCQTAATALGFIAARNPGEVRNMIIDFLKDTLTAIENGDYVFKYPGELGAFRRGVLSGLRIIDEAIQSEQTPTTGLLIPPRSEEGRDTVFGLKENTDPVPWL